ncbi:MAG: c-type cytochrome [Pseudomonadota bacterium]
MAFRWSEIAAALAVLTLGAASAVAPAAAADASGGDAARGEKVFAQCRACHAVGEGAANRVGPPLNELFGRTAGGLEGYRYSRDMQRAGADGLVWTAESLDHFLENPKSMVTRTRMSFRGMDDAGERADLIAYLRIFSASPRDIPEAEPTALASDPDAPLDGDAGYRVDAAILAIQGDPAYGAYLSGECVGCHQASGADEGIPSITGWPTDVFVTVLHAYKDRHRPHPVMQMIASTLSEEEIAALAAYFESVE